MNTVQDKSEPRSRRTALRHQDLHDRLLAAAEQAIAADGLANLRARALAEAVGCSVGAIYGVFPDLDALILAVNGRTLEAIDAVMRDAGSGSNAADHLVRLAEAYLGYAARHRQRWNALFQHRMPEGRAVTPWYAERQEAAFAHIEAPLATLQPGLPAAERALLARTLFSAVHGMVALGLDEKVVAVPLPVLRAQVRLVVQVIASGLSRPL
jgi:AcrR family transcriptional regulator